MKILLALNNLKKIFIFSILIFYLSACTSTPSQTNSQIMQELLSNMQCDEAFNFFNSRFTGEEYYAWFGIYEGACNKNEEKGIVLLSLAAQYGSRTAIQALQDLNIELPTRPQRPLPPVRIESRTSP